jgi:peptidylprolyl isomerase
VKRLFAICVTLVALGTPAATQIPSPGPVLVVETSRGTIVFETYPDEAPLTVAHVAALARKGFYDGQRIHRAIPGFVVQFGDPRSRDLDRRSEWGRGPAAGSGTPVGVAEVTAGRRHRRGAVGMAHMGDPAEAESQIYITLASRPDLDGRYVVFGQVIAGLDVPSQLAAGDEIVRVFVRE